MRIGSRVAASIVAAVPVLLYPTAASAAGTVTTVTVMDAPSNTGTRILTATCPAGRIATGAQAFVPGDVYGAHVTEIWPSGREVRVTAEVFVEAQPKPIFSLVVTAHCVAVPAGLTVVTSPARFADEDTDEGRRFGTVTAAICPAGKELVGMGGRALGGYLTHLQPLGKGVPYTNDFHPIMHGSSAYGRARSQGSGDAMVQSRAVCANLGNGSTFGNAELGNSAASKSVTAACPAGTQLRAPGFITFYPNHFDDLKPFSYATVSRAQAGNASLNSVRLVVQRHRDNVPAEGWHLAVQPLCAK